MGMTSNLTEIMARYQEAQECPTSMKIQRLEGSVQDIPILVEEIQRQDQEIERLEEEVRQSKPLFILSF